MGKKPAGQSSYPEGATIFADFVRVDKGYSRAFSDFISQSLLKSPILKISFHSALSISLSLSVSLPLYLVKDEVYFRYKKCPAGKREGSHHW
jgi:hypothetical protein